MEVFLDQAAALLYPAVAEDNDEARDRPPYPRRRPVHLVAKETVFRENVLYRDATPPLARSYLQADSTDRRLTSPGHPGLRSPQVRDAYTCVGTQRTPGWTRGQVYVNPAKDVAHLAVQLIHAYAEAQASSSFVGTSKSGRATWASVTLPANFFHEIGNPPLLSLAASTALKGALQRANYIDADAVPLRLITARALEKIVAQDAEVRAGSGYDFAQYGAIAFNVVYDYVAYGRIDVWSRIYALVPERDDATWQLDWQRERRALKLQQSPQQVKLRAAAVQRQMDEVMARYEQQLIDEAVDAAAAYHQPAAATAKPHKADEVLGRRAAAPVFR